MAHSTLGEIREGEEFRLATPRYHDDSPSSALSDNPSVHSNGYHSDEDGSGLEERLMAEVARFSEQKKRQIIGETDEDEWRLAIRSQMQEDLDRRVREAFEPPSPDTRMSNSASSTSGKADHMDILEREKLNAHLEPEEDEGRDYVRNQRWRVMQAKKRMEEQVTKPCYGLDMHNASTSLYQRTEDDSQNVDLAGFDDNDSAWGSGYKNQSHYRRVSNKAMNNFGNLSLLEKHEFYYAFTKQGFLDAQMTGRMPDGTAMTLMGNGRYTDKYGIVRDRHGPFWPSDYGPLHPTPSIKSGLKTVREDFYMYTSESWRRTVDSQETPYTQRWRGIQILYDSERTAKDFIPPALQEGICPSLTFESRFECGNLRQARRVGQFEYELVLKTDLYTKRHTQWFYFRVKNAIQGITYKFRIINLLKKDSLYNHGMRPLLYTERHAQKGIGWTRTGHHISYSRNIINLHCSLLSREMAYYMLEWQMEFKHTDDTCYLAHCYPYSYSDLKDDLDTFLTDTDRSKIMKREVMCETRAGNSCFLLTVTNFDGDQTNKKGVIVTGRVHPGETNSSWMMRGLLEYISGPSSAAQELRNHFVFKIVPMLNPDGVIVGNYRCSLAARDLNRNYRHPRKESFPTIWHTKAMMEEMRCWTDVLVYCDMHGHSRKQNVFMYGCNVSGNSLNGANSAEAFLQERLFPWLMSQKVPDKFNFNGCKFQIRRCKESTGRVVMFQQLNIENSFTMEATFCGSTICKGKKRHFNTQDLEDMGRAFCDVVLDYHKTQADKAKMSEVILDLTRAITQQILEARGLLPLNLPCLATQLGRDKLKEMVASGELKQVDAQKPLPTSPERVTQNFVKLIEEHSNPALPETSKEGEVNKGTDLGAMDTTNHVQDKDNLSKNAMNTVLNKLSERTIDGCVRILEQLHLVETALESDSSDSDSESEPEMKWVEPRSRKKKKKKKLKREKGESTSKKKQFEMTSLNASHLISSQGDLGLPAIQNADKERSRKQNMGKYVKSYVKSFPAFVNKYDKRSNGGIPCFSEERLTERAARNKKVCEFATPFLKRAEMKKRLDDERKQRDAMYYVSQFDIDSSQNAMVLPSQRVYGDKQSSQQMQMQLELRQQFHQALAGPQPCLQSSPPVGQGQEAVNDHTNSQLHGLSSTGRMSGNPEPGLGFEQQSFHSAHQLDDRKVKIRFRTRFHYPNGSDLSDSSDDGVDTQSTQISLKSYSSLASSQPNLNQMQLMPSKVPRGFIQGRHSNSAASILMHRHPTSLIVAPVSKAASDLVAKPSSTPHHLPKTRTMSRAATQVAEESGHNDDKLHRKTQPPVLSSEYTDFLLDKLRKHKDSPFNTTHPILTKKLHHISTDKPIQSGDSDL